MRTNREKYDFYLVEILAKDAAAIAALIPGGVPAQFYGIKDYAPAPIEVTGFGVYRRGIYAHAEDDRVTKDEVAIAMKCAAEWTAPTLDEIMVHYKDQRGYGTVTGAHPYGKIESDPMMAWTAEALEPEIERRRELYAPRDGHTACGYCRKQTRTDDLVNHMIYYRDQGGSKTKIGKYCSAQCGYHDQCGHEG